MGCSNIFTFHTYVGSGYFLGVQNSEFQYFLGFRIIFFGVGGGYEDFMDIFLGSSQNWASFRRYFYAFWGLFLRSMYRIGIFFGVAKRGSSTLYGIYIGFCPRTEFYKIL